MKDKLTRAVVIVPFEVVEHQTPFRFQKRWWRKRIGTQNCAVPIRWKISTEHRLMHSDDAVAILKKNLKRTLHYKIIKEIKIRG